MNTGTGIAVAGALVAAAIFSASTMKPKLRYEIVASEPAGAFRLDRTTGDVQLCYQFGCDELGPVEKGDGKSWSERYTEQHKHQ